MKYSGDIKQGFSQQQTKKNNTTLLFNLIRKHTPVSRVQLAKMTGLSATTVSFLVLELIESGLVYEEHDENIETMGRKPKYLYVRGEGMYFFVVDLFNRSFLCSLYDLNIEKVETYKVLGDTAGDFDILDTMLQMLESRNIEKGLVGGVSVIYPGPVLKDHSNVLASSTELSIRPDVIERNFNRMRAVFGDVLLRVDNDSSIFAYAEHILGDSKRNVRQMTIEYSEGIGAALVFTNDEAECEYYFPVEIGHIITEPGGPLCKCGNRGCFEAACNVIRIIEDVNAKAGLSLPAEDIFDSEANKDSIRAIRQYLEDGNKLVTEALSGMAAKISRWLFGVVSADQPDHIYLCGSVMLFGDRFLEMINKELSQYTLMNEDNSMTVKYSGVDNEGKRRGAAYMMLRGIYSFET
ncbi:MAG: ROK family transcriptional regulator [Clostridiales bacterium]|nr:ROK family transcriptional regulator [Clostridiales bacterium]